MTVQPLTADVEMASTSADEDDDEPADAESSEDEELPDQEATIPSRQKFFCCADDKKAGGFWWCPGCSKCFHTACNAAAEMCDGSNKVCKACHERMVNTSGRVTRRQV